MSLKRAIKTILRELKKELPLEKCSIKLEYRPIKDEGACYGPYKNKKTGEKYILLVLNECLTISQAIDVLLHEYAHIMMLDKGAFSSDDNEAHSAEWGRYYSRVYRAFLKINNEQF